MQKLGVSLSEFPKPYKWTVMENVWESLHRIHQFFLCNQYGLGAPIVLHIGTQNTQWLPEIHILPLFVKVPYLLAK